MTPDHYYRLGIEPGDAMNLPTKEEMQQAGVVLDLHFPFAANPVAEMLRAIADGRLVVCDSDSWRELDDLNLYAPATAIPREQACPTPTLSR